MTQNCICWWNFCSGVLKIVPFLLAPLSRDVVVPVRVQSTGQIEVWELIFIYCELFVLILVVFELFPLSLRFGQISPLVFFRWFTATSDGNAESCNRIPSNYCLPYLLSIAPRFWPSKPLAGLGRIWNRYLLTMLTWNRKDSTPPSAAPRAPRLR